MSDIEVLDHFKFLWDQEELGNCRYIVLQGGGGSGKSKAICQRLVYMFLTMPDIYIYVVRASMPDLTRSVYINGDPSIVKELSIWGFPVYEYLNKTERVIINPENGSRFGFIGLDDPEKIKSINANYVWIEEATELNIDKFTQLDIRMRRDNPIEGECNRMYLSYNPISYNNWVIRTFQTNVPPERERLIYRSFSNFSQNPHVKLENMKSLLERAKTDKNLYQTYIIGIPGIPMGQIYTNIAFESWQSWPEEVWNCAPYYGIDWGFIDPTVIVECRDYKNEGGDSYTYIRCIYYETEKYTKQTLDFLDNYICPKTGKHINKSAMFYYDYAEADRGAEMQSRGYAVQRAFKNIAMGISHCQGQRIVLDDSGDYGQKACDEVQSYTWEKDPEDDSKYIDEPIDKDNHFCDSMRYALTTHHLRSGDVMVTTLEFDSVKQLINQTALTLDDDNKNSGVFHYTPPI